MASFPLTARASQRPPASDWRTWLVLGGRGSGKTRTGAEWARFAVQFGGVRHLALIAPTMHDAREVMLEGISGLLSIVRPGEPAPKFEVSRRRLVWPNGARASLFSAEDPDSLRGPQFDAAWCDEVAAWSQPEAAWDMLQMGLRIGSSPRTVLTTTPRRGALLRRLLTDPSVVVSRSATSDNAEHLSPAFIAHVEGTYAGTRLGRQELLGELIEEEDGALWTAAMLETALGGVPAGPLDDTIVAIDPPAGIGLKADACGIVAAAHTNRPGCGDQYWVLADETAQGLSPLGWAQRALHLAEQVGASRIVAEANQGGEMVRTVLRSAGAGIPVQLVHAHLSKTARAAPVIALYEQGRVSHAGRFFELEEEMMVFGTGGSEGSPDRVDALVWAISMLALGAGRAPHVRRL